MNPQFARTRTAKFIGASFLVGSLFTALTGCASSTPAPAAETGAPAATASETSAPAPQRFSLVRVIDGDTVELRPGNASAPTGEPNVKMHMLGIDAPALDACGGPEAKAELERITAGGGNYEVKYDAGSARVDSLGNVQGYLYTAGTGTPRDLGSTMVYNGYAGAWYAQPQSEPKPEYFDEYSKSAQDSKKAKTGAWAKCDTVGKTLGS